MECYRVVVSYASKKVRKLASAKKDQLFFEKKTHFLKARRKINFLQLRLDPKKVYGIYVMSLRKPNLRQKLLILKNLTELVKRETL